MLLPMSCAIEDAASVLASKGSVEGIPVKAAMEPWREGDVELTLGRREREGVAKGSSSSSVV